MFVCRREHGLPWQLNASPESTDIQEPAYADAQTVISTTATTNNSHNQYRELRKEVHDFTVSILYQLGIKEGLIFVLFPSSSFCGFLAAVVAKCTTHP